MTIRPIIFQDKEKLLTLFQNRGTFNEVEIKVAMEVIEDELSGPEKKDYYAYCATNGRDEITGFICFGPIPLTDGCYDLYWIVVDEKFSRNGVGKTLLKKMEEVALQAQARRIYIDTSSTDPYAAARSFYEKQGFRLVAEMKDFYRNGDNKMIFMKTFNENGTS